MMKNTFPGASNPALVRANARIFLFALGFSEKPWDSIGFKLHDDYKKTISRSVTATEKIADLPEAKTFWHGTDRPTDTTKPALWIGKHGDSTHHKMPDRQSHHTTQYLLVQYFEQDHYELKPFPRMVGDVADLFRTKLGFTLDGEKVNAVGNIAVGTLDPKASHRGGEMPAVLVSALMHRRGHLHVKQPPEADVEEDDTPLTQGGRVQDWFHKGLDAAMGKPRRAEYWTAINALKAAPTLKPTGTTDPNPLSEPVDWLIANATTLAVAIPAAMKHAYAQMRAIMIPAIEPGLRFLEVTWYEQLAAQQSKPITAGGTHHVTGSMITAVAKAAEANNKQIMETQSHWA
jgi:hypothetical protein